MNDPLISVVVPCFNGAAFLEDCVRGVLAQKVSCEILVVDDGSTDDSADLARSLTREYPGVLLVCQRNQGPAAARNAGLRLARGTFVCFLDVDDQYVEGFFEAALRALRTEPQAVAVFSQLEYVDAHREVESWQREAMEASLPGNLLVRTEAARRAGGFPAAAAFRGRAAGEDAEFRHHLRRLGKVLKIHRPLFRYRVRRGSHFDFFLDRAFLVDGRVQFKWFSEEEMDGSLDEARRLHAQAVSERRTAEAAEAARRAVLAARDLTRYATRYEAAAGTLSPADGLALHLLARDWPGEGRVVCVGQPGGRPAVWLATGLMDAGDAGRGRVALVVSSPGPGQTADGAAASEAVSRADLNRLGLADQVEALEGTVEEAAQRWQHPVRVLFIGADRTFAGTARAFLAWSPLVERGGVLALHDVGAAPEVGQFYGQVCRDGRRWREVLRTESLGVVQRIG